MSTFTVKVLYFLLFIIVLLLCMAFKEILFLDLALVLLFVGIPFVITTVKGSQTLNYGMLVGAMGLLYVSGPILGTIAGQLDVGYYTANRVFVVLGLVALLAFFGGYYSKYGGKYYKSNLSLSNIGSGESCKVHKHNYVILKLVMFITCVVSVFFKLYSFWNIGFMSFIVLGRAASQKLLAENRSVLGLLAILIYFVIIVSLELYFESKEEGKAENFFLVIFVTSFATVVLTSFLEIDRSNLLSALIPVAFIINYHNKLSLKTIAVMAGLLFIVFIVWKSLFRTYIWGGQNLVISNLNWEVPSEIFTWFNIGSLIKSEIDAGHLDYRYGVTYLRAFESIFNPIFQHYESLSRWYIRTYFPLIALKGGGSGFSCIVESYLNFGVFGSAIVFFPIGVFYKIIEKRFPISFYHRCFYFISTIYVFQLFRSEVYSIVKFSFWAGVVPLVCIWYLDRRIKWR